MADKTYRFGRAGTIAGVDTPALGSLPVAGDGVKGISFHLADLNVRTEMNEMPSFYTAALKGLASADGVIDLIWRLSDFGMYDTLTDSSGIGKTLSTTQKTNGTGSHGVGGWASLFQFTLADLSENYDESSSRLNITSESKLRGKCNQKDTGEATSGPTDGKISDVSNAMKTKGYWPVELNVMRGIVTDDQGNAFGNMPPISNGETSAGEHYLNFVGKELTGARTGIQLFDNVSGMFNHLINESKAAASTTATKANVTDVDGVQYKIWKAINAKLTDADNSGNHENNIATKLVRYMLDPQSVTDESDRLKMRQRFFAGPTGTDADASGADSSRNVIFKRFGPSGGDCSGVLVGVDFSKHTNYTQYVDVPLCHGDVLEFNLTITGMDNSGAGTAAGGDASTVSGNGAVAGSTNPAVPAESTQGNGAFDTITQTTTTNDALNLADADESASGDSLDRVKNSTYNALYDTTTGDSVATIRSRFSSKLPGNNKVRDVTYRVRVHLEGSDTRQA